MKHFLNWEY